MNLKFIQLLTMMVSSQSYYVLLVALVQNSFYVHRPYNVNKMSIMLDFSAPNNTTSWTEMHYEVIDKGHLAVFTTRIPSSTSLAYLRYKVRLHFHDETVGDTEWRTLIREPQQQEETYNNSHKTLSDNDIAPKSTLNVVIFIAICCVILLLNLTYHIGKSQCTLWFNK